MYEAIVCRLTNVRKHPNADRLTLATAHGFQIVTGTDAVEATLGIFFPTDGQLSVEYANANDCVGYTDPITHEHKGGYFAKNRRVRAQKFRGEKSEGYFAPIDSVSFTGFELANLVEGTVFSELNDIPICNKYYTPATLKAMANGSGTTKTKYDNPRFAKHVETIKFKFVEELPMCSIIYMTEKLHGTSFRFGYVLDDIAVKPSLWNRILRKPTKFRQEYRHLNGTRNVVMGDTHNGYYGDEQFRYEATAPLVGKLHKGEVIYGELVGYTTTGASIMGQHDLSKLKDKQLVKKYSSIIEYKYGTTSGTCDSYVYRITQVNEDGHAIDLPWPQVKKRCQELGIKHVPELYHPLVFQGVVNMHTLTTVVEDLMEGSSVLDPTHIREGLVLRVEHEKVDFIKAKSFTFGLLEGYIKESDEYVDTEEVA